MTIKYPNTETGGHKAAEVSQPVGVHLERSQPGVGPLPAEPMRVTTPRRKAMRKAVAKLQDYMVTYDKQFGFDDYTNKTLVDDVLYGLGLSMQELIPSDFTGAGGYERFKQYLREHLK